MTASELCSFISEIASSALPGFATSTCERIIADACSTWSLKNSPKFFIYILHFPASTTTARQFTERLSDLTAFTARTTSESLPTPDGSIIILSGESSRSTFASASVKSPTSEQQIQPEFISVISIPASLRKPPSIPISPNSFSIRTTRSSEYASFISFFIRVVFPAPKNPEYISTLIIASSPHGAPPAKINIYLYNYSLYRNKSQGR